MLHFSKSFYSCLSLCLLALLQAAPAQGQFKFGNVKLPGGIGTGLSPAARDKLDKYILPLGALRTVEFVASKPVHPALNRLAVMFLQRVDYYNEEVTKY